MSTLLEYLIPIYGLNTGIHTYHFAIDKSFFDSFDQRFVEDGHFTVHADLEKKPGLLELRITFAGYVRAVCDRCLADINLPVTGNAEYLIKYSDEPDEQQEADVIWIHPDEHRLDVSGLIHESIGLSIPMVKVFDCESEKNPQCNVEVLDKLDELSYSEDETDNPLWDALKNIN